MKRVLFVDDEPRILDGLRRLLRGQRVQWQMVFALGGEAALAELALAPCDVVVTDMRMPGMDGATLLERVRERYPQTVRIALSGYTDAETAQRATAVAHRYFTKPCDPTTLKAAIDGDRD